MEEDIKRIKSCLPFEDYYSMLMYIVTIAIDKYTGKDKEFLLNIAKNIKKGNYKEVKNLLNN